MVENVKNKLLNIKTFFTGSQIPKISLEEIQITLELFKKTLFPEIIINENLAASMMSTGRYQIKTENYVGAIMKFSKVTYQYPKTKQAAEAYARLYEIYYKLGMIDLANKTKKEM